VFPIMGRPPADLPSGPEQDPTSTPSRESSRAFRNPPEVSTGIGRIGRKERKEGSEDSGGTDFETFWSAYPRHEAKDRALKAWEALAPNPDLRTALLTALEQHKRRL
jgi:hypothetical protein